MATLPVNNIKRSASMKSVFESAANVVPSSLSFNQGDLLAFDTSAHALKVVAADTDSQTLCGVAKVTVKSGKLVGPYTGLTAVDASEAVGLDIPGPAFGDEVTLKLNVGDAFVPGVVVYLATAVDAQTVTVTASGAGSHVIGVYQGPSLTAVSGSLGAIKLGCRYPEDTLKF